METITILIRMDLGGQAKQKRHGQAGYAMAALLVAMSIMAIMLTVVMPVGKKESRREKEEELVFRGKQYAHAIGLFQKKFANAYPPNLDVLVDQRFLRKKFKDPITNDDFVPIAAGRPSPARRRRPVDSAAERPARPARRSLAQRRRRPARHAAAARQTAWRPRARRRAASRV